MLLALGEGNELGITPFGPTAVQVLGEFQSPLVLDTYVICGAGGPPCARNSNVELNKHNRVEKRVSKLGFIISVFAKAVLNSSANYAYYNFMMHKLHVSR
jgi:hypothetical protein